MKPAQMEPLRALAERVSERRREEETNRARRRRRFLLGLDEDFQKRKAPESARAAAGGESVAPKAGRGRDPVAVSLKDLEAPKARAGKPFAAAGPAPRHGLGGAGDAGAFWLAAGYRPAVIKVISYGHGAARATAIGQYAQKDEAVLETHDGRLLTDKAMVADEMQAWSKSFDKRRPSDDVATFRLSIAGEADDDRLAQAAAAAFAGHEFAFRIERGAGGAAEIRAVVAMAGYSIERAETGDRKVKRRFHLSDKRGPGNRFSAPTRAMVSGRVADALGVAEEAVAVEPVGEASHGKNGVIYQLSRLVHDGVATDAAGARILSMEHVRQTAQTWSKTLNSYEPRDVMHLMLSAKADEGQDALRRTARSFLHGQFSDHKFAFALHDDVAAEAGHIHVHAIIAVKGENGERLRPGPADFRAWRQLYAGLGRAEGLKIVATGAAYRASSQSYGPRDKAIVRAADRPRPGREGRDRAYAQANPHVVSAARQRMEQAKDNPIRIPLTGRQLHATAAALDDWRAVASSQPDNAIAQHYTDRLTQAQRSGNIVVSIRSGKGIAMDTEATADQMRRNLREINDTVAKTAAVMNGPGTAEFLRRAGETMEMLAIRTDLKEMQERGVTHLSQAEAAEIAGPRADALVSRAHEIEANERIEAERADAIRDRAIEREERGDRGPAADPEALQQVAEDRAMVRDAETIAAREQREADAAAQVARDVAADPSDRIDANLAQSERLEELRRRQAHDIDTSPVEGEEPDKQKPQSI